jgi:hypothetical protein
VTEFASGELGFCGENGNGGGDSRREGSIPPTRRQRMARRTFSACLRRLGRRGTVALGNGHGGQARVPAGVPGREG